MGVKVSQFSTGFHEGATYSGSDMIVFLAFPDFKPVEIGALSTLSYTVYREKKQIRTIGRISPKGITKGPRTISGKMIFTVLHEHIAETLRREIPYLQNNKLLLMDELPPFDIIVSFGNEYGHSAGLVIQGVTTVDEQKTLSIEELFTENIFTYIARRLEPMRDTSPYLNNKWNPMTTYTSKFRGSGSEILGKFRMDELILTDYAGRLGKYDPFLNPAEDWEAVYPEIASGNIEVGKGDIATPPPDKDQAGQLPDYGSGDKQPEENGTTTRKVLFTVLEKTNTAKAISEAKVVIDGSTRTTNKKGQVTFTIDVKKNSVDVKATKKGYQDYHMSHGVGSKDLEPIYMEKSKSAEKNKFCNNHPDAKNTPGSCVGQGYWYNRYAHKAYVTPTKNSGKEPQYKPDIEFTLKNYCGNPLPDHSVAIHYEIKNWSKVKKNECWKNNWHVFCYGQVKQASNYIKVVKTDKDGHCLVADFFDFGLFPAGANVDITARPLRDKDAQTPTKEQVVKNTDGELWPIWHFSLNPSMTGK